MKESSKEWSLSKQDERLGLLLWFRISRIYNQSIRQSNQHLKKWELSAAQFDVLVQVGSHERLSQQELADKLFVTKGNITQLLSKMEQMGLIKREQEWKTKYLSLTEEGRELFQEVVPQQEQFQAAQFSGLDEEEKKQLLQLLRKIQHKQREE
ncbi:MarR family winged helix-turn-helix transcriptional regulator [Pseudobacillus badius]|uniref:MarR family winged helix-turn-helix transcriptional regulator n=1 Tax=Bacillus badius TaxID=1455 RepID=UPI0007B38CA2|nr:MarR family transcriptional regulator [Bacillus badius]KZR56921.1 MarR family transcriptional regulator [Bacillus badius]